MKLAFAGTPAFARASLAALSHTPHELSVVLTQPDRERGRGLKLSYAPVKALALELGLPVLQPPGLRLDGRFGAAARQAHDALAALHPDVLVVVAYGLILPQSILDIPVLGAINVHASLLPRWRGAAPVQRAIEAGDQETGVAVMQMDAGLDTGPIFLEERVAIEPADTGGTLAERLALRGAALLVTALQGIEARSLVARPQAAEGVTYAHKIGKHEAALDFGLDAEQLARRVRAFNPAPGCTALFNGRAIKVWRASAQPAAPGARPGTVLEASARGIGVACGQGMLVIEELQRAGGVRLSAAAFLAGTPLDAAASFA